MDINNALALLRDGKLGNCGLEELRAMSAGSVVFIQNRNPDAIHLKAAVDLEILRREAEQRHQVLISEQQRLKIAVDNLAKPHWVIWATFVAAAIAAIAAVILLFRAR